MKVKKYITCQFSATVDHITIHFYHSRPSSCITKLDMKRLQSIDSSLIFYDVVVETF